MSGRLVVPPRIALERFWTGGPTDVSLRRSARPESAV